MGDGRCVNGRAVVSFQSKSRKEPLWYLNFNRSVLGVFDWVSGNQTPTCNLANYISTFVLGINCKCEELQKCPEFLKVDRNRQTVVAVD